MAYRASGREEVDFGDGKSIGQILPAVQKISSLFRFRNKLGFVVDKGMTRTRIPGT
jgi:hypothetical protein